MDTCSCAYCRGIEPYRTDWAGCMVAQIRATDRAIRLGLATRIPPNVRVQWEAMADAATD
jgi:hypothetical protein